VLPFPTTATARREYRALAVIAEGQERHFRQRVRERFRITLSPQRYRHWIQKVEQVLPGTEFLRHGAVPGRTIWRIRSGSHRLHVVYDETTARLVTCLPPPFVPVSIKRLRRRRAKQAAPNATPWANPSAAMAA